MERIFLSACAIALMAGCSDEPPQEVDELVQMISDDEGYRDIVRQDHEEDWKGLTPEAALAEADALGLHPKYVAFLELYPDSELAETARDRLLRFRAVKADGETVLLSPERQKEMCWSPRGRTFRWSKKLNGGFSTGTGATFGALVLGTDSGDIQMIQGSFRAVQGGIELSPGTALIYPATCKPAN